jgi:hypothetical protein
MCNNYTEAELLKIVTKAVNATSARCEVCNWEPRVSMNDEDEADEVSKKYPYHTALIPCPGTSGRKWIVILFDDSDWLKEHRICRNE